MYWFKEKEISTKLALIAAVGGTVIIIATWLTLNSLKLKSAEAAGYKAASSIAGQIATMRGFYTSEILSRAKNAGIKANYDFEQFEDVLPLPATFVHELGEHITKDNPGMKVRLYSRFPFPHRAESEKYDDFEMKALHALEKDAKTPFWVLGEHNGRQSLRYAQADVMLESCVGCHNQHPETPKNDWKVGDTRGVIEVIVPMDDVYQVISNSTIKVTSIILGVISLIGLFIYFVIKNNVIKPAYKLRSITSRLSEGDLTAQVENESNNVMGQIGKSVNSMTGSFKLIISEITNSAVQVASASEELAAISKEAQQETSRQKTETEQVATAMNEMSATSLQVTENSRQAADAANIADQEALKGKEVVNHAANSINALANEVERVSVVIQKLQDDSSNIGTVLDVIRDIAEQTNLLALNAAIEAARAGEQGRGFAVVADEVRTLANRTEQSTKEIQDMIQNLQQGAQNAVDVMASSRSKADDSVEHATHIQDVLEKIGAQVKHTSDMYSHIATAIEEQSAVAEDMNKNITRINEISHNSESSSLQITDACAELAKLSSGLHSMVGKFKLEK